ncbi:hypothetical protein DFH07DRAFT_807526 [Mycena maculata]|uniref:Uncharacterized protein n=1 Tax=Mycena maculata TaxID=230809 RepID=A0AAD7JNZ9_9AGAR|nr:hypothetical protein DFH07DRAFT_807526 [Mycena maculata]
MQESSGQCLRSMDSSESAQTAVFRIQELVDLIIDFVSESRSDLFVSGLVSTAWVPRSQHHIFGSATLDLARSWKNNAPIHRFRKTLTGAVHLAVHIRRLRLPLDASALGCIIEIPWPGLDWSRLSSIDPVWMRVRRLQVSPSFKISSVSPVSGTYMSRATGRTPPPCSIISRIALERYTLYCCLYG